MYAQKNPSYHPIPELSLEAVPMPREGRLFQVPGRDPGIKGERTPKTCHTPMDWTGYWVERMKKTLALKGIAQPRYASALEDFLLAHPGAPSKHGPDAIGAYLLRCREELGLSVSATKVVLDALLFFYEQVLKAPKCINGIPRGSDAGKILPVSRLGKVKSRIDGMDNHQHRLVLSLAYACGLKNSELAGLRLADLHADPRSLTIRNKKGVLKRKVAMPASLAEDIAEYRKRYLPLVYLIESVQAGRPIGKQALEAVFKKETKNENGQTDDWRSGTGKDRRFVQGLLGHTGHSPARSEKS